MAKAKAEKLVERVIIGPKGIWVKGELKGVGETIKLPMRSAKAFARYLEAPGVAAAKAAVAKAEAEAVDDAAAEKATEEAEDKAEEELQSQGDDSEES